MGSLDERQGRGGGEIKLFHLCRWQSTAHTNMLAQIHRKTRVGGGWYQYKWGSFFYSTNILGQSWFHCEEGRLVRFQELRIPMANSRPRWRGDGRRHRRDAFVLGRRRDVCARNLFILPFFRKTWAPILEESYFLSPGVFFRFCCCSIWLCSGQVTDSVESLKMVVILWHNGIVLEFFARYIFWTFC